MTGPFSVTGAGTTLNNVRSAAGIENISVGGGANLTTIYFRPGSPNSWNVMNSMTNATCGIFYPVPYIQENFYYYGYGEGASNACRTYLPNGYYSPTNQLH